jgi:hypothetical protein
MNRARIAQLTAVIASLVIGGTSFVIYNPKLSTSHADLADAGAAAANRVATCPVRVSEACQAQFSVRAYETLRFPVVRDVLPSGEVVILMPAAAKAVGERLRECVRVVDWRACDLDPVASFPAVASRWGTANPFVRVRSASKYVIPDCRLPDGGWNTEHAPVDCRSLDGGWRGCNVQPRAQMTGTACLDSPSGVVEAGERIEDSL